uniref:Uncharacterized protein n=1 Tax=Vertebrata thuyoides TaxID=2006970 RepID=A0A1Z1MB81_9FLOR|nr:hypothetical protein [Vertebrata thuyoides]ARW63014.1 hypothetical protein [Vertebrata thuyoides]
MYSDNFLFYLYLVVVISILLVFSFFVSLQLKLFSLNFVKSISLLYFFREKLSFIQKDYLDFYSSYIVRFDYFKAIALSELLLENLDTVESKVILCSSLGSIYDEMSFVAIAEYYYLEALSYNSNDINLILNLVKLYSILGHNNKSKLFLEKALKIDSNITIPSSLSY